MRLLKRLEAGDWKTSASPFPLENTLSNAKESAKPQETLPQRHRIRRQRRKLRRAREQAQHVRTKVNFKALRPKSCLRDEFVICETFRGGLRFKSRKEYTAIPRSKWLLPTRRALRYFCPRTNVHVEELNKKGLPLRRLLR